MSFNKAQLAKYKTAFTQAQAQMQANLEIIAELEDELANTTYMEDGELVCDGDAVNSWDLHSNTATALGQFLSLYSLDDLRDELEQQ
jgi:hypothetical protein